MSSRIRPEPETPSFFGNPSEKCIHWLVEAQVDRVPSKVAVRCGDEILTYRDLDDRANRLAHYLISRNLHDEECVGVFLERGLELIVALLAILKAGCCYVPLDPNYPEERISFMLLDSGAKLVITSDYLAGQFRGDQVETVDVNRECYSGLPNDRPRASVAPEYLAYMIYTSGSTGRPKGTEIEHRCTTSLLYWVRQTFDDDELAGVLAATSVCFDLSIFEIFGPLSCGGCLVLVPNLLSLASLGSDAGVSLVNTVPSGMSELVGAEAIPASVRTVCLAGEYLTSGLVERLWQIPGLRRILNLYGPSEDTTYSTWAEVPQGLPGAPPIGSPLPFTTAYVLDESGREVADDIPGEMYLSGAGVARGYRNRPDETTARFTEDPFSARPGQRMYRTGDRVRRRPGGTLEFLGRFDDQVKVRGYRIELGEVAANLVKCQGVRDAVAATVDGSGGDVRLVGYVVGDETGNVLSADEVLGQLKKLVPRHMVPSTLVWIPQLPTQPNGKVDRGALPRPDWGQTEIEASTDSDDVEVVVARMWRDLVGADAETPESDFFAAGGDSLLATRFATRIRATFAVDVPLTAVFDHPTLAELTAEVRRAVPIDSVDTVPLEERNLPGELSFAQQRLWFLHQLAPEDTSYLTSFLVEMRCAVDVSALREALGDVIATHEAFRTGFFFTGTTPEQEVATEVPITLDRSRMSWDRSFTEQATQLAQADASRSMDLSHPPLARFRLASSEGGDAHVLIVTVHHIVFDGWSFSVFVRDLGRFYEERLEGQRDVPRALPKLRALAKRQRAWLENDSGQRALNSITDHLGDAAPLLELPTDVPRPDVRGTKGATLVATVDEQLTEAVRELTVQYRVTLYMVGLAVYSVLLSEWSGRRDLVLGSAFAGRTSLDSENVIGCFVNTVPLRIKLRPEHTFAELLAKVWTETSFAAAHQEVPFDRVVERLGVTRSLAHTPLVQVAFGVQNAARPEYQGNKMVLQGQEIDTARARLDLTLWLEERNGEIDARWTYSTEIFGEETMTALHQRYNAILQSVIEQPNCLVGDLFTPTLDQKLCGGNHD